MLRPEQAGGHRCCGLVSGANSAGNRRSLFEGSSFGLGGFRGLSRLPARFSLWAYFSLGLGCRVLWAGLSLFFVVSGLLAFLGFLVGC